MSEHVVPDAVAESERSISAVRWVLALIGAALALGSRSSNLSGAGWIEALAVGVAIVGIAGVLSRVPDALRRADFGRLPSAIILQLLDIASALALTIAVSDVLPDAAWALLTIPIVIASLRLNAIGVLAVWWTTSLGYTGLLWANLVQPGRDSLGSSILLERPGALLALAAGVALLTRWLQAGWAEQALLTGEAQIRFQHVQAIERAGREIRGRTPDEVVTTCLHHVVELGFAAATALGADRSLRAVGDGSVVPTGEDLDPPPPGLVELTEWHGPGGWLVYSAAMVEPRSGLVISGWSAEPPGTLQAEALSELVAHTTSGVELAELMAQARFEADHDLLTGLANRAQFERRLRAVAAEHETVAMMFMDLDRFKQINDAFGHEAGDWALQQVGEIMTEHVGELGLAARYGGDEFVALVSGEAATSVQEIAERLQAAVATIADRCPVGSPRVEVGISIGIALATGPVDPDELRRAADRAVFEAKTNGRGTTSARWLTPATSPSPNPAAPPKIPPPPPPLHAVPIVPVRDLLPPPLGLPPPVLAAEDTPSLTGGRR